MGRHRLQLAGQRFGNLFVVQEAISSRRESRWICRCVCGAGVEVPGHRLKAGITTSCGCWRRSRSSPVRPPRFIHGRSKTYEYRVWARIKNYIKNGPEFSRGTHIPVICPTWTDDFEAFFRDIGERPSPAHEFCRLNTADDFSPENCRWLTREEQREQCRHIPVPPRTAIL